MARTPRTSNGGAGVGNAGPDIGPEQDPDAVHDGAPGGLSIGADLPSVAVPGGTPMTTGGFAPSSEQDKLPAPGSSEGFPKAPDGVRR